jgi:hypothetical protein
MHFRLTGFLALFCVAALAAQAPRTASQTTTTQQSLPPLSYVCIMPGDEAVLEDKPGACPKCGMALVPVRLDTAWSCVTHNQIIQDHPGLCPVDKRELVQITASVFWSCKDNPDKHLLEPGKCADGSIAEKGLERRPHGDHNPRHGGQFFMASDSWHHVEGTYPTAGIFRVYFYNDFTQPMPVAGFTARVSKTDEADKEVGTPISLTRGPGTNTLQARIPAAKAPVKLKLRVKFKPTDNDSVFDFTFEKVTRDPIAPTPRPAPVTTGASAATQAAPASAAAPPVAVPRPNMTGGMSGGQSLDPSEAPSVFGPQEKLPDSTPELLAELAKRNEEVGAQLKIGAISAIWLPAIGTKDVALALDNHSSELPDAQRAIFASALKRLTLAAWQIDSYGDLGNKEKLNEVYSVFSAAVADIQSAYASIR